jgi:hypothetical protein
MNAIDPTLVESVAPDGLTPDERKARDARTKAFLASEAFVPFVLDCFARAVEDAAAENAELRAGMPRGS